MSVRKIICSFTCLFFVSFNVKEVQSAPKPATSSTTTLKTTSKTSTLNPIDVLLHNGMNLCIKLKNF